MGKPWEYPRWRRILMQVVMWLILGGTLGLAALVTNHRNNAPIELGQAVRVADLAVRVPENWQMESGQGIVEARDPATERVLTIAEESMPPGQNGQEAGGEDERSISFSGLGKKGVMVIVKTRVQLPDGSSGIEQVMWGQAAISNNRLVVVQLAQGRVRLGPADEKLIRQVADGITLAPARRLIQSPRAVPQIQEPDSDSD